MTRHPFYILACLAAVLYLALADARGWSLWQRLTQNFQQSSGGRGGSSFAGSRHK